MEGNSRKTEKRYCPWTGLGGKRLALKKKKEKGEKASIKNRGRGQHSPGRDLVTRGSREDIDMKTYFYRPYRLRENAQIAISCRRLGPARKKRYTSSREEEEQQDAQMVPLWQSDRDNSHCGRTCTRRNGLCWRKRWGK